MSPRGRAHLHTGAALSFFGRFTTTILGARRAVLPLLILLVGLVVSGVMHLGADFSIRSFFGRNDPETAYLEEYLERWGEDDMLLVVLDGGEQGLLTRERLQELDALATRLDELEGVAKVIAPTRVPRVSRGVVGRPIPVPLLATVPNVESETDPRLLAWRESLLADTRVVPSYLSEDGRYGAMMMALEGDTQDLAEVRPLVHRIEEEVHEHAPDGVTVRIGGVPAIRADVIDVVVRDQIVNVPVSGLFMAALLFGLFRSRHGVFIPVLAAGVPVVMLLGIMGWTGQPFGLLNQTLLALIPAIAVADAIHLVSRYHEEARDIAGPGVGLTREQRDTAIVRAMSVMGVACFLTSFTTIVGFLSLLQTEMPVLQEFGLYAAVGVGLAYFTVLFIVPLSLLGTRSGAKRLQHGAQGLVGTILDHAARFTTVHPKGSLVAALVITGLSLWGASLTRVDTKITRTFSEDHPTTQANTIVDEHLGGVLAYEFDVSGPEGVFATPEGLAALGRVEEQMASFDDIRTTVSPAGILRATQHLSGGKDAIPDKPGVIRYLYDLLADTPALAAFVDEERSRARLLVRTVDLGAQEFVALGEQIEAVVAESFEGTGLSAHLTGSSYVSYRGLSRVTRDLWTSLLVASLIIGVLIGVLFRSVYMGALSLLPNLLPLVFGYGVMGFVGWDLEPSSAIVFTIALGISVDSAIHVIARFREEQSAGTPRAEAVTAAIYHSGRAVLLTCVLLSVGFLVNITSSSPQNAGFGRIGAIIVMSSLVANLLVLPALLMLLPLGEGKGHSPLPTTDQAAP